MSRKRQDPVWSPVSPSALRELWAVFRTDSAIRACRRAGRAARGAPPRRRSDHPRCRDALQSRLLSGGILYCDRDTQEEPDTEFQDRVSREFVPFARDVLDALIVQGFAAFFVDAKRGAPVCVPPDAAAFAVTLDPKFFRQRIGLFREGSATPEPSAMFAVENWPGTKTPPLLRTHVAVRAAEGAAHAARQAAPPACPPAPSARIAVRMRSAPWWS
jgi:hypothetical protein